MTAGRRSVRAAVLSVGSELLLGDLTDTNATWISARLREQGVEVVHHLAARDELGELVEAVRWLADRVELIVVGGGLGPTADDLTREAMAAAAGVALLHHDDLEQAIVERFHSMGRPMAPRNARQARIPDGATPYPPVGTAPGFGLTLVTPRATRVIALPGVPWELHELWDRHVRDEVRALGGDRVTLTRVVHVAGRGESDVASVVEPAVDGFPGATLAFLARKHEVQVRLTVTGDDRAAAMASSQPVVDVVVEALGAAVVGVDDEQLEDVLVRLLGERGQTVATAESATAGDVAARLGRVPGASRVLRGGAVVYADEAKSLLLDVPRELVVTHGAVSREVTSALAAAVRTRAAADWGLAVTGVAGPASVDALPVGTCCWALAGPDGGVEVHERVLPGDRPQVVARLGTVALDLLRRRLLAGS